MQPAHRHLLLLAVASVVAICLLYLLLPYTLPFLFAALLAAIIDRPVDYLEKRTRLPRGAIVLLVLLTVLAFVVLLLGTLIANLSADLEVFYRSLPSYVEQWQGRVEELIIAVRHWSALMPQPVDVVITSAIDDIAVILAGWVSGLLSAVRRLPNLLVSLFIAAFTTYFLSRDKRALAVAYFRLVPATWHDRLFQLKRHIAAGSLGLVRGLFILMCITFTFATAAFSAFGIPYAWLLGFTAALLDVMPMVGPSGIFVPIIVHLLFSEQIGRGLGLAAVWAALLILRQMLEARVLGAQLGVHPLTMIFALYTGVKLFGLNGLWLAPFLVIAIKALYTVLTPASQG